MRKTKRNFKEAPGNVRADGRWQRWKAVGTTSVAIMAALGVATMNPVGVALADWQIADSGDLPSGAKVELNTTHPAQSEVTLTMDSGGANGKLNASAATTNPDAAADVVKRTATVGLTNTDGYVVNIKADSTNLTGTNTSNTIASVSANSTLGQMTNAWGWNGSVGDAVADCNPSGTFKPMKTTDQELGTGGAISATQNKKVTMCFGSRIDGSKVADTYTNIVTLSVVAQPGKTATFNGVTTMQEMTPAICKAANINDTAQLEDVRDGKKYWVTKLLDGNCWMSQNLALDLSTSEPLTSANSDVESSWTPGQTTSQDVTYGGFTDSYVNHLADTYSWNLGDYIIKNPTAYAACANNTTGLSACTDQFEPVGTRTPSTNPNFYKDNNRATYTSTEYDAHYLAGNYYQWNAATAGTGGTITDANASGSICPKNWKLPNSGVAFNETSGSFYYLLQQYGVQSKPNIAAGAVTSPANGDDYDITLSPLFFVQGGRVSPVDRKFLNAGEYGHYWPSRATSSTNDAYYLYFSGSTVIPSHSAYRRYYGYFLRCIVPTP